MSTYFAAKPTDEIGDELKKKIDEYYFRLQSSGHLDKIRKVYRMYYGIADQDSSRVHESGEQGELLEVRINQLRSLLNHVLVLTTQNKTALKAVAVNSDSDSMGSSRLGNSLLEYYFKTKRIEKSNKDAVELSLITGKGFVIMDWDTEGGKEYGVTPTGSVIYDGDVRVRAKSCLEVVQDIYEETPSWYIDRELVNKYDLITKYPELADKIELVQNDYALRPNNFFLKQPSDDDVISLYKFYHKKSPSVPGGRMVQFLDGQTVLTDGPLPYREPMLYEIVPAKVQGTQLGYTPAFDLVSLNEMYNMSFGSIITSLSTFGVPNVWTPTGSGLGATQLAGGLNHLQSDVKPEILNLLQIPGEMFKSLEILKVEMELASGINDVVRGSPQASLKSGSALALVASQALAYNSGLQDSLTELRKAVGMGIIHLLQDYASTPKVATIVGIAKQSMLTEFTGDTLQGIDRVTAEEVNAMSQTTAGKLELANNLLNSGLLSRPSQYLMLVETGNIDPMLEGDMSQDLLIQKENEMLRQGQQPQATMLDRHDKHILGHREVLDDPGARQDPNVVNAVLAHIQEHLDLARTQDPFLGMLLQQPSQPQMAPQSAPQAKPKGADNSQGPKLPGAPKLPEDAPQNLQAPYAQVRSNIK